jgi:hypothetical protein
MYNFRIVDWKIENRKEWENLIKGEKKIKSLRA